MKMRYERPSMDVEQFMANEYIAACGDSNTIYKFECNAGKGYPAETILGIPVGASGQGEVWLETNGKPGLQRWLFGGDESLGGYHPCGEKHDASVKDGFLKGYYISDYKGEVEDVIVWRGEKGNNVHCTTNLDIDSWETAKS